MNLKCRACGSQIFGIGVSRSLQSFIALALYVVYMYNQWTDCLGIPVLKTKA